MKTTLGLLLSTIVACSGCVWHLPFPAIEGSGNVVTESRQAEEFEGISLNGSADLYVQVGHPTSVTVEIDDNLLDNITTEVNNRRLVIGSQQSYRSASGLKVYVTTPSLEYLGLQGSGNVDLQGVDTDELQIRLSGSGDITGSGAVEHLRVQVNGSGDIDLMNIAAKDALVTINGSGEIRVHALEHLSATVRGSGDILYQGSPIVEQGIFGSGSITPVTQ